MRPLLGVSVGSRTVHAVIRSPGQLAFVGSAEFDGLADLAEVLARLAAESTVPVKRACVVLDRDAVQVRTLESLPPMGPTALRQAVALQASRLFRNGHGPLVTDARAVRHRGGRTSVVVAAADEAFLGAIARGCEQAGLALEAIGPACEVVPCAVAAASGDTSLVVATPAGTEQLELAKGRVCRSRLLRNGSPHSHAWKPPLASLGADAARFATAFAATLARPSLSLLPQHTRAKAAADRGRRIRRLASAATIAWILTGAALAAHLRIVDSTARGQLAALVPVARAALRLRRDLDAAKAALATMDRAVESRSETLNLLDRLTSAVGDSVTLVSVRITRDSLLHVAGYAPVADRVVASLERLDGVVDPRLEEPPSRQALTFAGGRRREWDRFGIVARLGSRR